MIDALAAHVDIDLGQLPTGDFPIVDFLESGDFRDRIETVLDPAGMQDVSFKDSLIAYPFYTCVRSLD